MARIDQTVESMINQSIGTKQEAKKFLDTIDASKIRQAKQRAGRAQTTPAEKQRSAEIFDRAERKAERARQLLSDSDRSNDRQGIELAQRASELILIGLQDGADGANIEAAQLAEASGNEIETLLNLPATTVARTVPVPPATPVVTDPATVDQNAQTVTTPTAADVRTEWNALKASFDKLNDIADRVKITNPGTQSLRDQIRYVLNTAKEGLGQGRVQDANNLIDTLRGLVSVYGADVAQRADRKDFGRLSNKAETITRRLGTQDVAISTPLTGQQFVQTMETIAPQEKTDRLQDRILALQNRGTDAFHRSLNTGADVAAADKKLNTLLQKGQTALDEGRLTRAQQLINQAGRLTETNLKASKRGDGAELTLNEVTQAYREAQEEGRDAEAKSLTFASKLFDLVYSGEEKRVDERGANDGDLIGRLMQELKGDESSSVTNDIIRLYANKVGYSYTTGSGDRERTRRVKGSGESLDDLYSKAVTILGGDRAMDGHRYLVRDGDRGRVKGTMFNDAVFFESGQHKKVSISTGAGNDTVFGSGISLKNASISTGGGKDSVALSGDLQNLRISTGDSNDQIQVAGIVQNLDLDAGDNSDKIIVNGLISDSTIAGGDSHDMMLVSGNTSDTTVLAGEGDDGIVLQGRFKRTTVDLSEEKREHGLDTVQVDKSFRGSVNILDDRHSRINWDYTYLKHQDTVLLGGMGWTSNADNDRFIRRDNEGKTLGQIILGSGRGEDDGEIEKVFGNGEHAFRDIEPHVNSKEFGVIVGEWAQTIVDIALSTINPGFAAVIAMKNFAMAAKNNNGFGMAISALSFVGAGASAALGGATRLGSSTYGMSPGTANTLRTIVDITDYTTMGLSRIQSLTDGDITISDVISSVQVAVNLAGGPNMAKYNQILDYVRIAASSIEKGEFDPSAALAYGASLGGSAIRDAIEAELDRQNAARLAANETYEDPDHTFTGVTDPETTAALDALFSGDPAASGNLSLGLDGNSLAYANDGVVSDTGLYTVNPGQTYVAQNTPAVVVPNVDFDNLLELGREVINNIPVQLRQAAATAGTDFFLAGVKVSVPGLGRECDTTILLLFNAGRILSDPENSLAGVSITLTGQNTSVYWNVEEDRMEFGAAGAQMVAPGTAIFYRLRNGLDPDDATAPGTYVNNTTLVGAMNSTFTDPLGDRGVQLIGNAITRVARLLEVGSLAGDALTVPSGESIIAIGGIELTRHGLIELIQQSTTWYVGTGWRTSDLQAYPNGEVLLNVSGSRIRLQGGDGPGGSGLGAEDFLFDLDPDVNRLLSTADSNAQLLGRILYLNYVEGGQPNATAINYVGTAYNQGGRTRLAQRALEALQVNVPNSVTDRSFFRLGMGDQSAVLAKGIYDFLRQNGDQNNQSYSPQEAWGAVWSNYISGNSGQTNSGIIGGGSSGAFNALRALAYDIGMDPTPFLPRGLP